MKRPRWSLLILVLAACWTLLPVQAEGETTAQTVYWIPIEQSIEQGLAQFLKRSFAEAEEEGASAIILEMDTLGGEVQAALEIGRLLRQSSIPIVVYIRGEAISAGAYIALNADQIVMEQGSAMGAAEPRTLSGQTADPKTVAFWASNLRAAAEATGRNPEIAAAMADRNVVIKGLNKQGQLVSLSAEQAIQWEMADKIVKDADELLPFLELHNATVKQVELTPSEKLARLITSPYVIPILLLIGIGGLAIELFTPGFGLPGGIGITALGLYFFGHYLAGFAGAETMVLFALGLLFLLIELFVPGFGIFGILGLIALVAAVISAAFDPLYGFTSVLGAALITGIGILIAIKVFGARGKWKRFILENVQKNEAGYVAFQGRKELLGEQGITVTPLRPAGAAQIAGTRYDVVSEGRMIPSGITVQVVRVEGARIVVRQVEDVK